MRIAIAGATGTVGRHVVEVARRRDHQVVPLSRSGGVDLTTGAGLAGRLEGVDVVVDVTNKSSQRRSVAEAFFAGVTGHLLAAEQDAGVGHHIALSIVGVERVPSGYYRAKLRQEQLVAQGPVPWSVVRATQFHEFAEQLLDVARIGSVSLVPDLLSQTVACADVAERLVSACEAGPSGRLRDLGGPAPHHLPDLSRRLVAALGVRRRVVALRLPGPVFGPMRTGALLPAGEWQMATTTFDQWLAGRAAG